MGKNKMVYSRNKKQEEEEDEEIQSEEDFEENEEENEENEEDQSEHSDSDSEAQIYKSEEEEDHKDIIEDNDYTPTHEDKESFKSLLNNIRNNVDEVTKKMNNVLSNFSQPDKAEIKYGISYLDSKNNFMLIYLIDLLLYSLLKANGKSIQKSSIIKQMIYLKTILEKTKVIDLKLKTQIDRLLKLGDKNLEEAAKNEEDENNYRPRILDNDEEAEDGEGEQSEEEKKEQAKYQVKRNFQEFFETTNESKSRKKQLEKAKDKIRNSEIYKDIREKFNDNPTEVNNYDTEYTKFMKEVEDYEDEHFTRVKVPKREIKKLRKMDRKANDFSDIGKEFKNLNSLLTQDEKNEVDQEMQFTSKKRAVSDFIKSLKRGGPGSFKRGGSGSFKRGGPKKR